jgi:hypothetical protein
MMRTTTCLGITLVLLSLAPAAPKDDPTDKESRIGASFHVPYRRTNTNHYLVRIRLNGKGPFNFLVDTGAPALFIGTETAKVIHLTPSEDSFWTPVDKIEIEGGAVLKQVKARIEDPFQLTGMNALGLPGAQIHGILGFTILAKFRMEFDPTEDRLVWTRLDYNPKEPFIPKPDAGKDQLPVEVQAMQALGPMMKFMALFVGKQPEDKIVPRGLLGVELSEDVKGDVRVLTVWPSSPAERAGLKLGDRLIKLNQKSVTSIKAAHDAIAQVKAGDQVPASIQRGADSIFVDLTAAEGL